MKKLCSLFVCFVCFVGEITAQTNITIPWADVDKTGAVASDVAAVDPTRAINTTAPLTGGGDLSTDRTLAVSAATDSAAGVVELATPAEALTGTDTARVPSIAAGEARHLHGDSTRAVRPMLLFDGWTSGAQATLPAHPSNVIGAADFTLLLPMRVDAQSAINKGIAILGGTGTVNNMFLLRVSDSTVNNLQLLGVTAWPGVVSTLNIANFFVTYAGKEGTLAITRSGTTATVYWEGEQIGTATAANFGVSLSAGGMAIGRESGNLWRGLLGAPLWIHGLLTPTEIKTHAQTGRLPDFCAGTGTAEAAVTSAVNGGTGAARAYPSFGGASATGFTAGGTQGGASYAGIVIQDVVRGQLVDLTFDYDAGTSGLSPDIYWIRGPGYVGSETRIGTTYLAGSASMPTSGTYSMRVRILGTSEGGLYIGWRRGITTGTFTISNISVQVSGPIATPVIQPGSPVLRDVGSNRQSMMAWPGVTAVGEKPARYTIPGSLTWSGTHEPKALLADQALLPSNAVLESITITPTASTSGSGVSVGDGDTSGYWVAASAHTAGVPKYQTLAQRFPASSATADLKIYVDPDDANYTGTVSVTVNYSLR